MARISATERALEKYREISNGSKEELDKFFKSIDKDKINKKMLRKLKISNKLTFYSRKCKNVYAIITPRGKDWFLVDILIKSDLDDLNK